MKLRSGPNGWISLVCDSIVVNKVRVCARCGELVDKWAGEFTTESTRYRLCSKCMARSMKDISAGRIEGVIKFEGWDENVKKQIALESALLSYHLREVE